MEKENTVIPKLSALKWDIRRQILGCFLDGKTHDINEVAALVGVSRQTVMKSLYFFTKNKLVVSIGKGEASRSGGKKPLLYALSSDYYLICVTLWGTNFRINLFDMRGKLVDYLVLDMPLPETAAAAADNIGRLSLMLIEKNHVQLKDVLGVSVSLPGIVDRKRNTLVFSSLIPQWGANVPLADYIRPYFAENTLFYIESPSKIHSGIIFMDDYFMHKRVLVITLSRGITGCLIENGHILNGTHSLIGEIGHMIIDPNDPEECSCGSHGCLTNMVSPERIKKIIQEEKARYPDSVLLSIEKKEELDYYHEVFSASEAGDPLAQRCSDYLAGQFAIALHNISLLFDPDYVVFVGHYFPGNELFSQQIYNRLRSFRYYPENEKTFEILYDSNDLIERDAIGSMLTIRWQVLNKDELYIDSDTDFQL